MDRIYYLNSVMAIDFLSWQYYNIAMTESEVMQWHHVQGGLRLSTPKILSYKYAWINKH